MDNYEGHVIVFENDGNDNFTQIIDLNRDGNFNYFGRALAASGDNLFISSPSLLRAVVVLPHRSSSPEVIRAIFSPQTYFY